MLQTIDDPDELEEELEFLRLEFEKNIEALRDFERFKMRAQEQYAERNFILHFFNWFVNVYNHIYLSGIAETQQYTEKDKDLMEFLQNEYQEELEQIEDLPPYSTIKEPVSQLSVVSKTVKTIPVKKPPESKTSKLGFILA